VWQSTFPEILFVLQYSWNWKQLASFHIASLRLINVSREVQRMFGAEGKRDGGLYPLVVLD
jgi:hypothetical protein